MQYKKIALLFGAFALLAQLSFTSSITHAEGVACNAYINPTSFDIQSTSELRVTVGNTGDTDINFIRIIPPSNAYTITANYSNEPWSGGTEEDGTMLFRDSVITPGNSMTFTMVVVTGASTSSGNAWTIESSADGGTNNTQCNGTTNTSVQGPYNISAPIISNVTISDINTTSFSLTWNTDKNATTIVNYGKTSAYSNNYSNTTLTQSHTANITGLETNTTYHFQIKSADSNNNEAQLGDNTVTTASSATIQTTTIVIKASPSPSPTPVPTPVPDTQKPEVTIFTESTKPYTTAPEIKGQATDNKGIDTIEYSVDQGKSWTGVDKIEGKGSKKAIFQFLPLQHEDGTYEIAIRALDTSQNRSDSKKIKYSIDRLPPIIGPYIATSGNQILNPLNNEITIPTKSDTTFTVPAVGGATEVKMQLGSSFIPFQQNETTHLWSTTINLQNAEKYPFAIYAKDNAGNETLRDMNTIQLVQQGRVVTEGNLPLPQAKINIFKKKRAYPRV